MGSSTGRYRLVVWDEEREAYVKWRESDFQTKAGAVARAREICAQHGYPVDVFGGDALGGEHIVGFKRGPDGRVRRN